MKIAGAVILLFFGRFLTEAWFYPHVDADIAWQRWLGKTVLSTHHIPLRLGAETFTAPYAPWIPQEWLFSTIVAALWTHWWIVACIITSAGAGALYLIALRAKHRGASEFAIALTITCAGFAMMGSFGARAQIFGWLLLAAIMLLLDQKSKWKWAIPLLIAIWANLHASAVVAPVIVGVWAVGISFEERAWTPRVRDAVLLTLGSAVAICATPFLWHLLTYAFTLQTSSFHTSIAEWQPTTIIYTDFSLGVLPLLAMCAWFGVGPKTTRWSDTLLCIFSAALALIAVRHLPLAAVILAPLAAQKLSVAFSKTAKINLLLSERFSQGLIYGSSVIATAVIALMLTRTPSVAAGALPYKAIAHLGAASKSYNLYCQDFAWCSIALGNRNLRVFIDGRCDPYPKKIWDDYLSVERGGSKWLSVLDTYKVNAVLAKRDTPLNSLMQSRREWRVFYRDKTYTIFTRQA